MNHASMFYRYYISVSLLALLFAGCAQQKEKQWTFDKTITLEEELHPLGITVVGKSIWVSAPDQNKVIEIDQQGNTLSEYGGFERPMHIAADGDKIFVPSYLNDRFTVIADADTADFKVQTEPDAPAGIFVKGDTVAVADFYNNRIILEIEGSMQSIGQAGSAPGQLNYPTDVEIYGDKIYVADAYNHRVQVFSMQGEHLRVIGAQDSINVATGMTVHDDRIFVTDFYNQRILIYSLDGTLQQTLTKELHKPTDIIIENGKMLVANYGSDFITQYVRK